MNRFTVQLQHSKTAHEVSATNFVIQDGVLKFYRTGIKGIFCAYNPHTWAYVLPNDLDRPIKDANDE